MAVDRDWMYDRLDDNGYLKTEYVVGVNNFIKFACQQDDFKQYQFLKCPCSNCWNKPYMEVESVKLHLYKSGYRENYSCWSCHGEAYIETQSSTSRSMSRASPNPYLDMVVDAYVPRIEVSVEESVAGVEEPPNDKIQQFYDMLKTAEKPLFDDCNTTLLEVAARITSLKCEFNIPHRAIDGFASLMKDTFPNGNVMTETFYATRKLMKGLELPHQKIDVCRNGCILYRKDYAHLERCPSCNADRFKPKANGNLKSRRFLIYFPLKDRLQRIFALKSTAAHMSWHSENLRNDEVMIHPRDGEAWKSFDATYPNFAADPRNVRLGLCTDGFSPFGKFGKSYSCWPVILTPYNLPPSMCMKRQTLFLSLLIPGPKNPKGKLDTYLQPLIEELKQLWEVGALTYDASKKKNFLMKAALMWTISDFPAYGMLSGWSTAGRLACPYCMEKTKSFYLKHGHKHTWFDCHRQFLPQDHVFRQNKSSFVKNRVDLSTPPVRLSGDCVWNRVSSLPKTSEYNNSFQKSKEHNWTKQSIFWELPYWNKLLVRHNLDLMHIEKNFFDQLIHTIMEVKGKTKDTKETRKDLPIHCKRRKLHLHNNIKKTMPPAPFVLSKDKRKVLCKWVLDLKFPDGYASNLGRCVNLEAGKLFGMKSHDCHVFLERLLPVAVKELLPTEVWKPITEISQFFRDICSSSLNIKDVIRLQENIPEILCKLERIFPPAFFNVMEHLPIHLPYEAKVGGPVQYRWMYPFESDMASRINRLRGSAIDVSPEVEHSDETQSPDNPFSEDEEEQNEEDLFATLNGISNAHGNPTTDQVISPLGLWFDSTIVVQVITDGIQAYYDAPYTCWKNSSPIARDQWWRFFRDKFKWLPKHSDAVKVEFKKKAGHRIKDMANKASKVPSTKTIFWMSPDMRKKLKEVRSTVEFKKRSEQSLQNRMGGPKAGTKHCQGSISSMQIAKRMMKKNGQMPTASELFVKTHQRSKDKSFCDPRAEKLYKDFESDVVATQENGMVSDAVKNDIFIKHSGGFNRQGAVYGVGNGAALFYQRPSLLSKNLNQTQAVPSVVSQLEQQLKATTEELETTKSQLIKEKQKTDGHAKDLVTQKKLIDGLYVALNSISQEMHRCAPSQFDD